MGRALAIALFVWLLAAAEGVATPAEGTDAGERDAVAGARTTARTPAECARRMVLPQGFTVAPVAAEPVIRQPVAIDFDARGRLWVMQYLQYPNPAGLRRVQVDRYSRTVYDRVPEPPPHGPRGADRLTILHPDTEEASGMRAKDFVSGLNLASGFAFGHGGVFVLQVPYLLFYPDRDRDDVPDGDPEVLLEGFGMEDAHSVANSLTWGPDGWLYGCQGSTVTARIRGIEFQQGVWRYHPVSRAFELFCEGGGNSWGLDFDRHGNLFYSTNHGGFVMLHGVQGGYYWKAFGKHGALHHPFAFGYFDHVPHENFLGGHVTVGGIVYQADQFPPAFRDTYIGADLLGHGVSWHQLRRDGSTFRSRHGGELLRAHDDWFAPSDVCLGPDGCVYVADWHDARTAHPDPDADWDRSNGRIYRVAYGTPSKRKAMDLYRMSTARLVELHAHPNGWWVRTARRLLAERRDPEAIRRLRKLMDDPPNDQVAVEALWTLATLGNFDEKLGRELLTHASPAMRRWGVRLLGDTRRVSGTTAAALEQLAVQERDAVVRSQLACSARRLPLEVSLPILCELLRREEDASDRHLPLLLWWGLEPMAIPQTARLIEALTREPYWRSALAQQTVLPRLVRRLASAGTPVADAGCVALFARETGEGQRRLFEAFDIGLGERPTDPKAEVSVALRDYIHRLRLQRPHDDVLLRIACRWRDPSAMAQARQWIADTSRARDLRVGLLGVLGEHATGDDAAFFLDQIGGNDSSVLQSAALMAWQRCGRPADVAVLLQRYPSLDTVVRGQLRRILLAQPAWAEMLLSAVDHGRVPASDFALDEWRIVAEHRNPALMSLVRKHWGSIGHSTPEEKLAEVRRLNNDLRAGIGVASRGRELFHRHCAACHKLFGEGTALGPDLTHANRRDRHFLLVSLVDPSHAIRKEYLSYVVQTHDGRLLTGLLVEQTASQLTLADAKNERIVIGSREIAELRPSTTSLMPENLYREFKPQELRDLFAYLESEKPLPREVGGGGAGGPSR